MSVKTANGHISKRRKLSHSSSDESEAEIQPDGRMDRDGSTDEITSAGDEDRTSHPTRTVNQRKRSGPTMLTGGMTKSSLMLTQISEMLEEVQPDRNVHLRAVKPLTDKLTKAIESVSERQPMLLPDAEKKLRKKSGVAVPFGPYRPAPDVKYKFEYRRPESIAIRGPVALNLGTKDDICLEVAVKMPPSLFQEKDYLNYRALHKRAYYIACLAAGLRETLGKDYRCRYSLQDENDLSPVIMVEAAISGRANQFKRTGVVINALIPSQVGPADKLRPDRNCVRTAGGDEESDRSSLPPTPVYNSTLRMLASSEQMDGLLRDAAKKCGAFRDACMLGQIWLRQRGFASAVSAGGFGLSEWAYVCALLLHGGGHKGHSLFSERYSSLQLFKAMLQVLANKDLTEPTLLRSHAAGVSASKFPVIYDGLTQINVLFKMSPWSYESLKHYAQLTLTAVNGRGQDSFEPSFILKVAEPFLQCDEIHTLEIPDQPSSGLDQHNGVLLDLHAVLKRGLGDRVSLLTLRKAPQEPWDVTLSGPKKSRTSSQIEVRLLLNPDAASRLIDHGPSAEQREEAQEFQRFWGEKSELRRFRNGSITETLVWSSEKPVTCQIIQYLVLYHFKVLPSVVKSRTPDLLAAHLDSNAPISATDAFKIVSNKYQELSSKLHQLEGLPLPIRSVSPTGQALRSASIEHPLVPATSAPIDMLIQFDSSTRWPDHLGAIQHTKIAFLAKISDLIVESEPSITTRIGLENTELSNTGYLNTSFLDIVYPSPARGLSSIIFRLRIHHERELHLLQSLSADKSLPGPSRDIVAAAILQHKRTFLASPPHTTAFRNLITHFPPLSTTIRLLKRWIAQHNLSNHVPAETLEIIAAYIFLRPYPWSHPGTATTAFLRCLHLLSHWDWTSTPLMVDLSLSQDMTTAQIAELETRYQAWRKLDPNLNTITWFVGSNVEQTGTVWNQGASPARVVAGRVTALARAAVESIKGRGMNMSDVDWENLFMSSLGDFDFVIHLRTSVIRGGGGKKNNRVKNGEVARFKNLQVQEELDVDSIGHDVVALYLADLERAFGSAVLFFHGDGARYIAGLWRPSVSGKKEWKVRLGYSTVPYAGQLVGDNEGTKGISEVNKEGMLAEMTLLGDGLIERVSVKE